MRKPIVLSAAALLVVLGLASRPVVAQERIYSIGLGGGVSGSIDEDNTGFSNPTFQLRFAAETTRHRNVAIRVGRMDFGEEQLSQATDVTIDYVTIGGEYLFTEAGHESGFLMGLGYYSLSGTRLDGVDDDEGALGLVVGAIGEFDLGERWFISADVLAHYAALDAAQIFASLQIGVGFRF